MTIIPRGRALGVTQYLPEEDRVSYNESRDPGQARPSLMGGRAAERLVYRRADAPAPPTTSSRRPGWPG